MGIDVVILAAGQGTRMKSKLPKVLHKLANKPMVQHVVDTAQQLSSDNVFVVIGHGGEQVTAQLSGNNIQTIIQEQQLGTGHAVDQALPYVNDDNIVLVLYGDVPLTKTSTLEALLKKVSNNSMALLTVTLDNPTGYGRIIRDADNQVLEIVEQKDANQEQLKVKEVNTGILAAPAKKLKQWMPTLSNKNAQGEYYLTDIIAMAVNDGVAVETCQPDAEQEVEGCNNRLQIANLERWYQRQIADQLMTNGNSLADPNRIDVRGELITGNDNYIDINVVFEGKVTLGSDVSIGPNCFIRNASIGDGVVIEANSTIDDTIIGSGCTVGPYARLRPGTELKDHAKIGNFVETKKTIVGEGSKINHLSYAGDSVIGNNVNIGAGTITCNYDGINKSTTTIKDGAFIGSNTALVAPVEIGENATVAAGSTITENVPEGSLAISRSKQSNISGWQRPTKKN